jgi:hypothetical protein
MAKIILGHTPETDATTLSLKDALASLGHDVLTDDDIISDHAKTSIVDDLAVALIKADAFLAVYDDKSIMLRQEIRGAIAYAKESGRLVALVLADARDSVPPEFHEFTLRPPSGGRIPSLAPTISDRIAEFQGMALARQQFAAEAAAKLEQNSSDYIDDVITTQRQLSARNFWFGNIWHVSGFVALMLGAALATFEAFDRTFRELSGEQLFATAFRTLAAIALLGACARYSFVLGKTYSNESQKNIDRIHAISFGRFYLRAFGEKSTWPEVKDVFEHWNIDRASSFEKLDASSFDPRLVETFSEMFKAAVEKVTPSRGPTASS